MKQDGFTLVELMVVTAIIGILTSVAVPNYVRMREKKYMDLVEATLLSAQRAVEAVHASSGGDSYPVHSTIFNNPAHALYTPCSSMTGDAAMVCSALPIFPANTKASDSSACTGIWTVPFYAYSSDGTNYKIFAHCAGAAWAINSSKLRDPARPTWSLSVTNNHAVTDSW